jgi:succinoglycan biosynthesis transport protein ExoP
MAEQNFEEESNLDIRQYFDALIRWSWVVVVIAIAVGTGAYFYTKTRTPIYQATSLVQIQQTQGSALPTFSDLQLSRALASTYKELITTTDILSATINELGLSGSVGGLRKNITISILRDTSILRILAKNENPHLAASIANTVASQFQSQTRANHLADIAEFMGVAQSQGIRVQDEILVSQMSSLSSVSIVEPAIALGIPIYPRVRFTVLVASLLATVSAILGIIVIEFFNDKATSSEEIERRTGLIRIATILRWTPKEIGAKDVTLLSQPRSTHAEAFRQAKVNVQFLSLSPPPKRYLVTSPGPGVGKTTFSVHLATAIAQEGKKVILIDSDFRRPGVPPYFSLSNQMGLSSLLANPELQLEDLLQPTTIPTLRVLTAGPNPPNSVELLGSDRLTALMNEIGDRGEILVIDSAPIMAVTDSSILASKQIETILLVDPNTRMGWLKDCISTLRKADATVLGYIHNRINTRRFGYGYASYNYYNYYKSYNDGLSEKANPTSLLAKLRSKLVRS